MTMRRPGRPWLHGSALTGVAALLALLACVAPGPMDAGEVAVERPAPDRSTPDVLVIADDDRFPVFTPYSVRPRLRNRDEVAAVLQQGVVPLREDAAVLRTAEVWLFLDEEPTVRDVRMARSTGHRAVDALAMDVGRVVEFTPALNRDQERSVWVSLPITFETGDGGASRTSSDRGDMTPGGPSRGVELLPDGPYPAERRGTHRATATGTVSGVVRATPSGRPLGYVQVFVRGTGRGTLSDAEGRFRIDHVPAGQREVVAHLIGYGEMATDVSVDADGRAQVAFGLRQTVVPIEALIVGYDRASGGS